MSTQTLVLDPEEDLAEREITVDGLTGGIAFRSIGLDGQPKVMGQLGYLDYDNRQVRRLYYRQDNGNTFNLGNATGQFKLMDHYQIFEPMLEAGFLPQLVKHGRGGAKVFAVMTHPEISVPDTITWDSALYKREPSELRLSVGIWSDMRVGKNINLTAGFFRVICTNGLISKILGLGDAAIAHRKFAVDKVNQFIGKWITPTSKIRVPSFDSRALQWPRDLLRRASDQDGQIDVTTLPQFVQDPVLTLTNQLPQWAQASLATQMDLARAGTERLSVLDILNMLTNVSNERDSDRIYFRLETLTQALLKVTAIGAFKNDIPFSYN